MSESQQENKIKTFEKDRISYLINEKESTVGILDNDLSKNEITIPRSVNYNSKLYNITSILGCAFQDSKQIRSLQFADDSEIRTFENKAFLNSSIECIKIPASLVELKKGWCNETTNLIKFDVSPKNPYFKSYDNKFIIGKSSIESENFDVLVFCIRNIEETAIIPSFIKKIESFAFQNCKHLKKIEVQEDSQLQCIEKNAFSGSSIESIKIPSNLIALEKGWCLNTQKLANIDVSTNNPCYKMYEGKFLIGKSSMNESENFDVLVFCNRNAETATIPSFIKCIGPYAFNNCKQLKSIEIPEDSKFQSIEKHAFSSTNIECFTIPSKLNELRKGWCENTPKLTKISINADNLNYKFYEDKLLLGKSSIDSENFDVLIFCNRNAKTVKIPSFIKRIEPYAFNNCMKLQIIEISDDSELQSIEKYAFFKSSIENIKIPIHVSKLGKFAFSECKKLRRIEIPKDSLLEIIEKYCFSESSIESFTIPSHVKRINEYAFYNCKQLQNIEISIDSELQAIERYAFSNSIIKSIRIPVHVSLIGDSAFFNCSKLRKAEIPTNSELQIIEKRAFKESSIESIIIPSNVEFIGEFAFNNCNQLQEVEIATDSKLQSIERETFQMTLINKISIPSSVKEIKQCAFLSCPDLISVEFASDSKLQIIEDAAFSFGSFQTFKLPFHVKTIGDYAFAGCMQIKSFEIPLNSELKNLGKNVFFGSTIESFTISSNLTKINNEWCINTSNLMEVKVSPENPRYSLYEDKMVFEKSSTDLANHDSIFFCIRNATSVTIPSYIKTIDSNAFNECKLLETIEIPADSQLQTINDFAFSSASIKSIIIPQHVTKIGKNAFSGCSKLESIIFSSDSELQIIDERSFSNSSIVEIEIPPHVTKISKRTFFNCKSLHHIEIPDDSELQTIEKDSFCGSSIENLTIPSKLIDFQEGWCLNTQKLNKIVVSPKNPKYKTYDDKLIIGKASEESENFDVLIFCARNADQVTIPSFVKQIGPYAFNECKNLHTIDIPNDSELQTIEKGAFLNSEIESITIPSKLIELKNDWCYNTPKLNKFSIHPDNKHYINHENNFIVGKTSENSQDFDLLNFVRRNIDIAIIPSNIKRIGKYAFNGCNKLFKVQFHPDSKLQYISEYSFYNSSIKNIVIPSNLVHIENSAFYHCMLQKIEFPTNSKLEIIGEYAFMSSHIDSTSLPPNLTQIGSKAFYHCKYLQIIEGNENLKIDQFNSDILLSNQKTIIMIPYIQKK